MQDRRDNRQGVIFKAMIYLENNILGNGSAKNCGFGQNEVSARKIAQVSGVLFLKDVFGQV